MAGADASSGSISPPSCPILGFHVSNFKSNMRPLRLLDRVHVHFAYPRRFCQKASHPSSRDKGLSTASRRFFLVWRLSTPRKEVAGIKTNNRFEFRSCISHLESQGIAGSQRPSGRVSRSFFHLDK